MSGRPFGLKLYRAATWLAQHFAPALLKARAKRGKEDPERLPERLGKTGRPRPEGPLVWLHGASVGESMSLLPLVKSLGARRPDLTLLITSGTVASAEMMAKRLPPEAMHQFAPVDTPDAVARFVEHWRPALAIFVESELWPNLILEAKREGVRLALLSARLSEESLQGWSKAPVSAAAVLSAFDLVMAQDDATAARLSSLGADDSGRLNLKLAGDPLPADAIKFQAARNAAGRRPVLLAASTHPGEDEMVLDAYQDLVFHGDRPLLVIVPRHPVRGPDIVALAEKRGLRVSRRAAGAAFGETPVYVADTLGELGLWFRLAKAAFIGGSLVKGPGGHNPVEPARLGCPFITGPYTENWSRIFDLFRDEEAVVEITNVAELTRVFAAMLDRREDAVAQADRARSIAELQTGAVDEAVDRLLDLLPTGGEG
ncbi:MAG: 3-deoxy-D-manno-octulosonic acid transferase [Caulobacteraceae bacterium]